MGFPTAKEAYEQTRENAYQGLFRDIQKMIADGFGYSIVGYSGPSGTAAELQEFFDRACADLKPLGYAVIAEDVREGRILSFRVSWHPDDAKEVRDAED